MLDYASYASNFATFEWTEPLQEAELSGPRPGIPNRASLPMG